jgi:predicted MarR family transcription regulator
LFYISSTLKLKYTKQFGISRHGKEITSAITPSGQAFLRRYTEIRERRLIDALITIGLNNSVSGELAQYLRRMSGLYDQAARAATSI